MNGYLLLRPFLPIRHTAGYLLNSPAAIRILIHPLGLFVPDSVNRPLDVPTLKMWPSSSAMKGPKWLEHLLRNQHRTHLNFKTIILKEKQVVFF